MSLRTLLLTLPLSALPGAALAAAPQALVYDITAGAQHVGSRTVTIQVIPPDGDQTPETRLITAETRIDARVAGVAYTLHSKTSARATDRKISFVSSTVHNGDAVEIQARQAPDDSWMVTAVTPGQLQELTYRSMEVDLTSVDLLDPVRYAQLRPDLGQAEILLAETGTVVEGAVSGGDAVTVQVGGEAVPGTRVSWAAPTGPVSFTWSEDGVMLEQDLTILGKRLTARLRALPPARSWGTVDVATGFTAPGTAIHEQEL